MMAPPLYVEIRLLVVLAAMFFLPGSALLAISGYWQRWEGLQRYVIAVGLSLSFYPVLFYGVRFVLPSAQLTPVVLWGILAISLAAVVWGIWQNRFLSLRLQGMEWLAVAVLTVTLATRFWFANVYPFPAWSDSLHHTLLTQLTAVNGRLPYTLEPYFPNPLDMYHLGLYALSGTAQMLAQAPAHSALLWTAQFLNGLCGLGIYLALDKYAGRTGAIVGLAVAGLFSAHPALWGNWGRFTQLSSLIVLPISWVMFMDLFALVTDEQLSPNRTYVRWAVGLTAVSLVAVFLYHFRVAVFYALLLAVTLPVIWWQLPTSQARKAVLRWSVLMGGSGLLLTLPVLVPAATVYFTNTAKAAASATTVDPTIKEQVRQNYYVFPLSTIPYLAAPVWLLAITGASALLGLLKRHKLVIINLVWVALLVVVGNLYLLNIPALNVTNFGAILIMLYLPIGIIIGAGVESGLTLLPEMWRQRITAVILLFVLIAAIPAARQRATTVELYRHFVTEDDVAAMNWIKENVPEGATFAINTYFWFPTFAHGTDAGYWIPYFTGHHIVTSSMLTQGLSTAYRERVLAASQAAEALETDVTAVTDLYNMGVYYIYAGARGDFSGPGIPVDTLAQSDLVEMVYRQGNTAVFRIKPPQ